MFKKKLRSDWDPKPLRQSVPSFCLSFQVRQQRTVRTPEAVPRGPHYRVSARAMADRRKHGAPVGLMSSPRPRQRFRPCNRSLDTTILLYMVCIVVDLLVSAALRRVLVTNSILPLQSFIGHNYYIWYVVVVLLVSAALRSPWDRLPFTITIVHLTHN